MAALAPEAVQEGAVSRDVLKRLIGENPDLLRQIELIVHPLVAADRAAFIKAADTDIVVLDIPILFETGAEKQMNAVACVDIDPETQKQRVMARGTMTEAQFEAIRAKQMPNAEKCARADYVIRTDTLDHARAQVQDVLRDIRKGLTDA